MGNKLSPEQELLLAALEGGENEGSLFLLQEDGAHWVRANGKDFKTDPARYVRAFRALFTEGYIDYQSGDQYLVTDRGRAKAKDL